jgi:hypothetical protein
MATLFRGPHDGGLAALHHDSTIIIASIAYGCFASVLFAPFMASQSDEIDHEANGA